MEDALTFATPSYVVVVCIIAVCVATFVLNFALMVLSDHSVRRQLLTNRYRRLRRRRLRRRLRRRRSRY